MQRRGLSKVARGGRPEVCRRFEMLRRHKDNKLKAARHSVTACACRPPGMRDVDSNAGVHLLDGDSQRGGGNPSERDRFARVYGR